MKSIIPARALILIAVISLAFLSSCDSLEKEARLSDPEIASVAVTANQIDIEYAQIAMKRSENADVIKFAQTMAKDHQSVIDQAIDLAGPL